jgi:hypothetical protein
MPHPKNPTPARIVPDGENWALPGTDIPAGTDPFQYAGGILAGILSLVAERDALNVEVERLRKVVGNLWKVIPAGTAEALRNPTHPYADVWAQQYSLELPLPNPEPE